MTQHSQAHFSINAIVREALRLNEITVNEQENGKLNIDFAVPIQLDTSIEVVSEQEDAVLTRLEVRTELPDGRILTENYGDVGDDFEQAMQRNWESFQSSSLPVLIQAFNQTEYYDLVWELHGQRYQVYTGDLVMKAESERPQMIEPEVFFNALVASLSDYTIGKRIHFLSFYLQQDKNEIQALELVLDNERLKYTEEDLLELGWQKREDFYSIRLFMVAMPVDSVE